MDTTVQPSRLSQSASARLTRLRTEFEHYAPRALKIRSKSGAIVPFELNRAQRFLHRALVRQRLKTGKIRALVLKGRQQGVSTYIAGRFYWRVSGERGRRVFILTHEQDATDNLFGYVERFHEHVPEELKPTTGASNAKELAFTFLDSGYQVGTAGTKAVGRSQTIQMFHGSEVAFWPHAETHAAGALQAVPDEPGTEVILESTANGIGNLFHSRWLDAEAGISDFIAVFIPWFWDEGYRRTPEPGFRLSLEESEYAEAHKLDDAQMCWRRAKIVELGSDWLFKQEYPATAAEAFQVSGADGFISPEVVLAARKCTDATPAGKLIVGVDPARFGNDSTAIIRRRTRVAYGLERHHRLDTMEVAGLVVKIIREEKPAKVCIDVGGLGAGVVDRLRELGYGDIIEAVNFGESPMIPPDVTLGGGPLNRRAEMWMEMREWLKEPPCTIPDDDKLHGELCAPMYSYDSNQRLKLESKEQMMKRGLRSPDGGDSLALTFAVPVIGEPTNPMGLEAHGGSAQGWMG